MEEKKISSNKLENWIDIQKHQQLIEEAKKRNTTVTRLVITILDHWISHSPGCEEFITRLQQYKEYLMKVAKLANYEESTFEALVVEALDRGLSLVLSRSYDHLPFAI